jgi:hypothetical protein
MLNATAQAGVTANDCLLMRYRTDEEPVDGRKCFGQGKWQDDNDG